MKRQGVNLATLVDRTSPAVSPWLLLLTLSYGIVGFAFPIAVLADSFVRFARSGVVLADSLVRIAFRRLWERPPGTLKTVPGLPEA